MNNPIFWICISFIIIIVIREIVCWYWKINDILDEHKKQTQILEEMLYTMNPNSKYFTNKEQEKKDGKYIL